MARPIDCLFIFRFAGAFRTLADFRKVECRLLRDHLVSRESAKRNAQLSICNLGIRSETGDLRTRSRSRNRISAQRHTNAESWHANCLFSRQFPSRCSKNLFSAMVPRNHSNKKASTCGRIGSIRIARQLSRVVCRCAEIRFLDRDLVRRSPVSLRIPNCI